MRWAFLCGIVVLSACAPAERAEPGVLRQAFLSTPEVVGTISGARLGASLAACPTSGYVAGGPGTGSVVLSRNGLVLPAEGGGLGTAVACLGPDTAPRVIAAGSQGVLLHGGGGWQPITTQGAVGLARSEFSPALPLLVGQANKTVRFIDPTTLLQVGPLLDGGLASFGAALTWYPQSPRFVVGAPNARRVQIYDYDGGATLLRSIPNTTVSNFGWAVAVGDVSPRPGLEIIVGSQGGVFIYGEDGTLVQVLEGADPTFGTSLALERGALFGPPDLDALWVGEPGVDRVYRFLGDAGTASTVTGAAAGISFGASLSFDGTRRVSVGAPNFGPSQVGAVFTEQLPMAFPVGEVTECTNGSACQSTSCHLGECIGGVFCTTAVYNCLPGETCSEGVCLLEDGGVARPDAGITVDAGMAVDAGPVDAGLIDAGGTVDAGAAADAGPVDAGSSADAGTVDAGASADAGTVDAGVEVDAGTTDGGRDAGSSADAGNVDAGVEPGGTLTFTTCGCSGGAALPMVLLSLVLSRRRR